MPSEIIALGAGRYRDQRAFTVARGNLGAYGSRRNCCANLLHSAIVKKLEKISRQRLGAHPSSISPDYSIDSQHLPRGRTEYDENEVGETVVLLFIGGRSGRTPEADEGHIGLPNIYRKRLGRRYLPSEGSNLEGRPADSRLRSNGSRICGPHVNSGGRRRLMHARLAEAMDYVEERRKELLQSFEGVPGDRLCRRASDEGWSVAEILEHLRMVEAGVARLITKRVGQAREAGLGEERSSDPVLPTFDQHSGGLENAVMQSPATVVPRANIDINEAVEGLEGSREALRAAAVSANGLSIGEIKHTHPVLGELDLYQWLIFVGQHEGRHKKQIERTLKSIPE